MKFAAILGGLIPYIIFAVMALLRNIPGSGVPDATITSFVWLVVSPMWFAGGCLIAYREGQMSKQETEDASKKSISNN